MLRLLLLQCLYGKNTSSTHALQYVLYCASCWIKHVVLCHAVLCACRNPADMGGRMLTFTYVAALSGLVAWSTYGTADSILQRLGVSDGM